jgi:Lar family restriction alleviation protein
MIELTDEDVAAIKVAIAPLQTEDDEQEAVYRAGLAAGLERAARECDVRANLSFPGIEAKGAIECAAAIRALVKPMTTPAPTQALLPCPFCGAEAVHVVAAHPKHARYVMCVYCNNTTAMTDTAEQAAELWNRRLAA